MVFGLKDLFKKFAAGTFLMLIGVSFGYIAGGIFESMGILANLPWQEFITFLGAIFGFLLGFAAFDEEEL